MNLTSRLALTALFALGFSGCIILDDTPAYGACGADIDCQSNFCHEVSVDYGSYVATNGICTRGCSSDAQCPIGITNEPGGCYSLGRTDPFVCYERCFTDGDCPTGFTCADVAGSDDQICLPR